MANTLYRAERLNSEILIERMFADGSKSFFIFPLRVVHMPVENQSAQASVLLSVLEKRLKRMIRRNRVKRQLHEAHRLHKHLLLQTLTNKQQQLAVAFTCLSNELTSSAEVEEKIKTLLARISKRLVRNICPHVYYCFPYTFTGLVFRL